MKLFIVPMKKGDKFINCWPKYPLFYKELSYFSSLKQEIDETLMVKNTAKYLLFIRCAFYVNNCPC